MAARKATLNSNQTGRKNSISHHQPITSLDDCKSKQLPAGFAETILELEILLDNDTIEIEKVKELLELYMIGVEYYESVGDQRFIYFNKKMSSLMMKPNVIDAMQRGKEDTSQKSTSGNSDASQNQTAPIIKSKEDAMREAEIRHKEENIRKTVNYSHQDNDEKAKAILKIVQQEIKQNQKIIHDSLDTQKRVLFERLQNRRSRTLTKASSVPVLTESQSSDNDDSSVEGSATITSKIDFSAITNAIREDDREDENDEDLLKLRSRNKSILEKIKQFKEKMLNEVTSPNNIAGSRSLINNFSSSNKVRSNSQASQMRHRNSVATKNIREKKVSTTTTKQQKRRVKSKSFELQQQSNENDEWQQQVSGSLKPMNVKNIEPFQVDMNFKQIIQEKQEEDDESSSPIRQQNKKI